MSNSFSVSANFKWNETTKVALQKAPDKILYAIASQTLDKSIPTIPMSTEVNGGTLRKTTKDYNVKKSSNLGYHIKSNTDYAVYPYHMNDATTNWSTANTHSEWFDRTWNEQHETIINSSISQNKI